MRIFVYGTLLSGQENHHQLRGLRPFADARTESRYTLVNFGAYPAMFVGGTTSIAGEVYEVDDELLGALDRFEGAPGRFRRERIDLLGGESAEGYVLAEPPTERYEVIAGGDWRKLRRVSP